MSAFHASDELDVPSVLKFQVEDSSLEDVDELQCWYLAAEEACVYHKEDVRASRYVTEHLWCRDARSAVLAALNPISSNLDYSTTSCLDGLPGRRAGWTPQYSAVPPHRFFGGLQANSMCTRTTGTSIKTTPPLLGTRPMPAAGGNPPLAAPQQQQQQQNVEEIFNQMLASLGASYPPTNACSETPAEGSCKSLEESSTFSKLGQFKDEDHQENDENTSSCSTSLGSPRSCPSSSGISPPSESRQDSEERVAFGQPSFEPGTVVMVDGLLASPQFNGLAGTIHSLDTQNGRYNVLLASQSLPGGKQMFKIKGENIQVAMPFLGNVRDQ